MYIAIIYNRFKENMFSVFVAAGFAVPEKARERYALAKT